MESIIRAAIEYHNGEIVVGSCHGLIIQFQGKRGIYSKGNCNKDLFLTSDDHIVSRKEAAKIAYAAGQLKRPQDTVYSEDILPTDDNTYIYREASGNAEEGV